MSGFLFEDCSGIVQAVGAFEAADIEPQGRHHLFERARLGDQPIDGGLHHGVAGIGPLADHPAGKISGGQMKLLELARVLMGDPAVILLDEPAAGVNPSLTRILIDKIEELNRGGKTFVIIEHDMDFVMSHCDPVIALAEGRVVFQGTAAEAQANPVLLDAYLGAMADG